ncbi:MAG TPA: hypothetical protein VG890_08295, partial [Puia sp.]|nr:hypothetical protein [Puia sp.]
MQVLKFGGSSVANAENIAKTVQVIRRTSIRGRTIAVVSALGGITDTLLECAGQAASADESYRDTLNRVEQRHLDTVRQLIPLANQSGLLSLVKKTCNELEDI